MPENTLKTTTVGSYPAPIWLRSFSSRDNLKDAIMLVFKTQEMAGLDLLVDGELHRWDINHGESNGMIDYFVRPLSGIETTFGRKDILDFKQQEGMAYRRKPAGMVIDNIGPGSLNLQRDFEFVQGLTDRPIKFAVTSPYMLGKVLVDRHYGSLPDLVFAIAAVLAEQLSGLAADVIQVDEANLTGHPEDSELAASAINTLLVQVKCEKAVHLCFGNYGGQTIQKGSIDRLVGFINGLECDHVVLEMARRPKSDLEALKDIKPRIGLGIGVIDVKDLEIETPELVASRIESAVKITGIDRIHYVHPDCGLWMLPRSVADAKMRALVLGRDLYLGKAG